MALIPGYHIGRAVGGYGLAVQSVGVKHIILPGEMKAILARAVEAEKSPGRT